MTEMKLALRDILLGAFGYWDCPIIEEERNLFRIEIEAGGVAEAVCEASGTVHIGVEEFEEDVIASYEVWRSFTQGSYYLHRLLERLSEGPITGRTRVGALHQSPPVENVLSLKQLVSPGCRFTDQPLRLESSVDATTFHFAVSLLGVEPKTELISITVEPLRKDVLPESNLFNPSEGSSGAPPELNIDETFPAAARELKDRVAALLDDYKKKRAGVTSQAVRKIRAAKKDDLASLPDSGDDPELSRRRAEVEEIWTIREQDARIRGEAERVDISLVAATIQERPITLYSVGLALPVYRERALERLYDRATGWLAPLRCEVCLRRVDAFIAGEGTCLHLMCGECAYREGGCAHALCQGCSLRCGRCRESICTICWPPCVGCGKISCPAHREKCADCQRFVCDTCSPPCPACAKRSCSIHGMRCPVCGQVMCSAHRRHRNETGMFRIPLELIAKLYVRDVYLEGSLGGSVVRGRKAFLNALLEVLGEADFNKHKTYIMRHADKCYEIWVERSLQELINYVMDFQEAEAAFRPENWRFPFDLREQDKDKVWRERYRPPEVITSLDDIEWWLSHSPYRADPFLNEYGFLPEEQEDGDLEGVAPEMVMRMGWFEHDRDSDPTQDIIPFYDPGALDNLAVVLNEEGEDYVVTPGRAPSRYK
jgi:hypothetical protein